MYLPQWEEASGSAIEPQWNRYLAALIDPRLGTCSTASTPRWTASAISNLPPAATMYAAAERSGGDGQFINSAPVDQDTAQAPAPSRRARPASPTGATGPSPRPAGPRSGNGTTSPAATRWRCRRHPCARWWGRRPRAVRAGSLAKVRRRTASHDAAPFCQASDNDTTWSICTAEASALANTSACPVYGSVNRPATTTQPCVPGRHCRSRRSRLRMSFARVAAVAVDVGPRRTELLARVPRLRGAALDHERLEHRGRARWRLRGRGDAHPAARRREQDGAHVRRSRSRRRR